MARCSVCKTWICRLCGKKIAHQWYCPACSAKKENPVFPDAGTVPAKQPTPFPQQSMTMHSLLLVAGITLGLCGLVFGLWNMRTAADLSSQNSSLREKRSELLSQIRERNREIATLNSRLDSMRTPPETVVPGKRNPRWPGTVADLELVPFSGLPVSFDNGTAQKKLVALTFDGSDQANAAGDILDTLKLRNVKVTMFLSGRFMQKKQDVEIGRAHV
jgi:hypothetical protein